MNEPPNKARGRRTLLLLALVALAPVVASYVAFYWVVPTKRLNYGELLTTAPAPTLSGTGPGGAPFALTELRGKWVLLIASGADCAAACEKALYATRQARTIQGREQDRVVRAWLQPNGALAPSLGTLTAQSGLVAARVDPTALAQLPLLGPDSVTILVIDPRGNLVLRYGGDPDIKRLANDLGRLLRTSQIG
ncbi:MAG: hypothetical protein ABI537_09815 [Casimicrobiaceae bacterium]